MDVFIAEAAALAPHRALALSLLSPARREKALAFVREEDALLSICAGLLLRRFVGDGPFLMGRYGKPELPGGPCFSLSHSRGLAALAVYGGPVGVDTEALSRPLPQAALHRMLTAEEYAGLTPGDARGFFTLWTRKEAVLKACGLGLNLRPDSFCVLPGRPCRVDGRLWTLAHTETRGHIISAAVEATGEELTLRPVPVSPGELLEEAAP